MSPKPAALRQAGVLAVALALWSLRPIPAVWALLLAYVLAVWIAGALRFGEALAAMPAVARGGVLALLLLPGGAALWRVGPELASNEGLNGVWPVTRDRLRLEALPSIAPPLVSGAQPQSFYVHADAGDGERVRVQLGSRARVLQATSLGAGLFRIDYDPRKDGPPYPPNGSLKARIWVGEREGERAMQAATPLAHPRWFALSPSGHLAATVSTETDELIIVSARGLERRIPVGDGPSDCAFTSEEFIAISHEYDPNVWLIDSRDGSRIRQLNVGDRQRRLAQAPGAATLAIARGGRTPEVVLYNWFGSNVDRRLKLPAEPDWLAFTDDSDVLIVATRSDARLRMFDLKLDSSAIGDPARYTLALGRPVVALGGARDGREALLATTDHRPDGEPHLGNHFVQDQLLRVDRQLNLTGALLTARRSPRQSRPGDVDRGLSPMGMAQSEDGSWLVTFAGSDELWRLRSLDAAPEITDLGELGLYAPHGVVELADGTVLVSSPSTGAIGVLPRDGEPRVLRLAPDDAYLQAHDRDALAQRFGERGFYEGTRAGMSCQSCHLHADSDRSLHNLGDRRLLPTLSARGLLGTGPYLRDGSYPELADLDHVATQLYRGYLRSAPARGQTLAAYLAALPRLRPARDGKERDLAAERRGVQAFVGGQCTGCHAFPAFTQLGLQRPASLFPRRNDDGYVLLDVPSLLSAGASAPYLSDGRAQTLRSVLDEHDPDDRHGNTAALSADQRRDLVTLLEAL